MVFFVFLWECGGVNIFKVMEEICEVMGGVLGVLIFVDKNVDGFFMGKLINLEFMGEDMD